MRFQVPQFIDIESTVIGPLTFKQFIYLFGGGGMIFILYSMLPFFLTAILAVPIGGLAAALAFYKVNNQSFVSVIENAIKYITMPRLYLWKKAPEKPEASKAEAQKEKPQFYVPTLTSNKLKDLAWSLDVKEKVK